MKANDATTAPDSMGIAANGAVGFGFMRTMFESIAELSKSSPTQAANLAEAGAYWTDSLSDEMRQAQDAIEEVAEGGAA